MKIVTICDEYLEKILKNFPKFPNHGDGDLIYFENEYYFIPLTSKRRTLKNDSPLEKSKYYIFSKKATGTLLIQNYIHCHPSLIKEYKNSKAISHQLNELTENRIEIEKKMEFQKKFQEQGKLHIQKEKLYSKFFFMKNQSDKRTNALTYMEKAINSMAAFEKIAEHEKKIKEMLSCKIFSKTIEIYEIETITRLKQAWLNLKRNLMKGKLTLNYIIQLNEIVAGHQALEVGSLRAKVNYVSGEFRIEPPKKNAILTKIEKLNTNKKESRVLQLALDIFYSIIVHQWFYDGNKRTAFLVLNKILIENNLGILLIKDCNRDEFEKKLYSCYKATYANTEQKLKIKNQSKFFKFLKEKCFIIIKEGLS